MFGAELNEIVLRACYGLAKGQSGVAVKLSSITNQTGLSDEEVMQTATAMVADSLAILSGDALRVTLTGAGVAAAKADAERETNVVFADGR